MILWLAIELEYVAYDLPNSIIFYAHHLYLYCSCSWKGQPCDIDGDFVTVNTDLGVCYTFNHRSRPMVVEKEGMLSKSVNN